MVNTFLLGLALCLIACIVWLNYKVDKEMKRNRIFQAFIAGIIRTISDYNSKTDRIDADELPDRVTKLPIPYDTVLKNIDWELSKDFLLANYEKWLKQNRNIFFDDKRYRNDGFNFIYLDLFDKKLKHWYSDELMSPKKREWLSEEIIVTEENVRELEGEIDVLRDLMNGKIDSNMAFLPGKFDEEFSIMFSHIRSDKLLEAKRIILSKMRE